MDQKSIISSAENDVIFPLTLSQAVQYLATQRTENIHELGNKEKNKIYNKTWQHLSVRLRLIFKKFPKTIIKITFIHDPNRMNLIGKALLHQMSDTRTRHFYKKLFYIYYSITMCFIQHPNSPVSSQEVPKKWLKNKKIESQRILDFYRKFNAEIEYIQYLIPSAKKMNRKFLLKLKHAVYQICPMKIL